jgi:high affinity Mn2+ porin
MRCNRWSVQGCNAFRSVGSVVAFTLVLSSASLAVGQANDSRPGPQSPPTSPQELAKPGPSGPPIDPAEEEWSLHFQTTVIIQGKGSMDSPYSGPNSLSANRENATSLTSTLFLGRRLWPNAALYIDPEVSGGSGLSRTLGIAGFPNGETTRVATTSPRGYIARLYLEQSFDLGDESEPVAPEKNQLGGRQCTERLTFTAGKLSATDIFDDNTYSHDPRTQFMNWSLMTNGAWDYPADTRGYTYGGAVELTLKTWAVRYGLFAMPEVANGAIFDHSLAHAHGQTLELEYDYSIFERPGKLRLMGYLNNAHMGNYRKTIENPAFNLDITQSRSYSVKYGVTLNGEQKITEELGFFIRAGWNDGKTETFAFTEIDRSFQAGLSCQGSWWSRPEDTLGLAVVVNGLSKDHHDYLAAGGLGFILGDGRLTYGPETIFEAYYQARFMKSLFVSLDFQFVSDPGYNRDRGPVSIIGLRVHVEF